MRARTLWSLSLLVTAVMVGTAVLARPAQHSVRRPATMRSTVAPQPCVESALAVLRDWDHRRARAWARGDSAALAGLYVAGSRTARRDLAMLARYSSRGLRVRSMDRQVLALQVRACRTRRMSLLLTDRLVDAVAVGRGDRTGLPPGRPFARRVDLRQRAGVWRVSEVTRPGPGPL